MSLSTILCAVCMIVSRCVTLFGCSWKGEEQITCCLKWCLPWRFWRLLLCDFYCFCWPFILLKCCSNYLKAKRILFLTLLAILARCEDQLCGPWYGSVAGCDSAVAVLGYSHESRPSQTSMWNLQPRGLLEPESYSLKSLLSVVPCQMCWLVRNWVSLSQLHRWRLALQEMPYNSTTLL